ncbi:MAG: AMP-binding protein [Polyangia bacterium]
MTTDTFNVAQTLCGRRILFIGATGFVGKVALSMLLHRYPDLGTLFVLTRAGAGSSSEERFFDKIASSPVFDPLRERFGGKDGFLAFMRDKCVALPGDVSRPNLNFGPAELERLGQLDVIVNCAGLVTFNPTLESAIRINVLGPRYTLDLARRTGASVVHVSTCFVAGNRDGEVWEDDQVTGYFPRRDDPSNPPPDGALRDIDFSVESELADCQRVIEQQKSLADDRAHVSLFRDRAWRRLTDEGRDPEDPQTMKIAVQRERKMWLSTRLTELGMERARHWGWTNTYTYTKSLGDQMVAEAAQRTDELHVNCSIVRPAIVESAMRYPFPGWNEGFTTTAPLAFLNIKGHRTFPVGDGVRLDVIPVDLVCAGLIMAMAATIAGENELVYQLGSSDSNPLYMQRGVELLGLHKRRYYRNRTQGNATWNALQARMEPVAVDKQTFDRTSAPLWRSAALGLSSLIEKHTPRWGAPRIQGLAAHARESLAGIAQTAAQTEELFTLFMPFIHDRRYVFRCDHIRALSARLSPADQLALRWDPERIDWRHYWLEVHMRGLERWVFPSLEEEFEQRPRSVYTYKDLLELFDATTHLHKSRTALRLLDGEVDQGRYTYADLQRLATRLGTALAARGIQPRDHVVLCAENHPTWAIAYFGILKAGAVAVPVDHQATADELGRIVGWSHARLVLAGERSADRLLGEEASIELTRIESLLEEQPTSTALVHQPRGDDLASLIFTSGTTGNPKGVMLSHRNFTSLLSKLASVFDLDSHDGLLSVLPLHHTLEFSAGLLMPLMRGAQITYLRELDADALKAAFSSAHVTGMVGVPALFELFERNIRRPVSERGGIAERLFDLVAGWMFELRERLPPALAESVLNIPRILFWPIHQRFGGRLRLLISGGAALDPSTMKSLRGLGFNLYEGYGLTEAAPVLAVGRQRTRLLSGSVGEALPGVTLSIADPDASGVGEIVAQAPSVMLGYYENDAATAETIDAGWLRTGDLGRIEDGRLYVVGRKKELILGPTGENIYPDELEELYRDAPDIKELSVVGLPDDGGRGEVVAVLVVPSYDGEREASSRGTASASTGNKRQTVRDRISAHIAQRGARLPAHKRLRVVHFTDLPLPRTATRKVKRHEVVRELQRLEALRKNAAPPSVVGTSWIRDLLAQVSGRPISDLQTEARIAQLGFDSLMLTELGVALEAAGVQLGDSQALANVQTVGDLEALVASWPRGSRRNKVPRVVVQSAKELRVPAPLRALGGRALDAGQRLLYQYLDTQIVGRANVPLNRPFLVAANHSSHLDMGLVKEAIGDWGPRLTALAAKDYFFDDPIRRLYFESFTNLVPMDRHGSLRESLRLASREIEKGNVLLIFPEGTRARDGVMTDFKPAIGYLSMGNHVDILPIYLEGTYGSMPSGKLLPRRSGLVAHVGPVLTYDSLRLATAGAGRAESYRMVAAIAERAVRALAPPGSVDAKGHVEVQP